MRRPVIFICGAYCIAVILSFFFDINIKKLTFITLFIILFFCIYIIKISKKKNYKISIYFLIGIMLLIGCYNYTRASEYQSIFDVENQNVCIIGKILHEDIRGKNEYKAEVVVEKIFLYENNKFKKISNSEKILVKMYGHRDFNYIGRDKIVEIKGNILFPMKRRNPKLFDYRNYLKSKKIYREIIAEKIKITEENKSIWTFLSDSKYDFHNLMYQKLPRKEVDVAYTIMFGGNSIDENLYNKFQKNGICHILAASGLHLGFIYAFIQKLLFNKKNNFIYIIIIIVIIIYAFLADFSPSITRALIMIIIHVFSKILNKRYDFFSSGIITMFIMMMENPLIIFSLGFQFSFLAFIIIAIILPVYKNFLNNYKMLKNIFFSFIINFSISPIIIYHFNYFSFSSFFINIPSTFIAGLILINGIILFLIELICNILIENTIIYNIIIYLENLIFIIIGGFTEMLIYINDFFYIEDISFVNLTSPSLFIILAFYTLIFLLHTEIFLIWKLRNKKNIICCSVIMILMICFFVNIFHKDGFEKADIIFVDVGQGDCILFRTPRGKNILIDSGGSLRFDVGEKILKPFLLKNGIKKIDLCIITHLHKDHMGGVITLKEHFPVNKIAIFSGKKYEAEKLNKIFNVKNLDFEWLNQGDLIKIEKGFNIEVLFPPKMSKIEYKNSTKGSYDENLFSLVMKVTTKNKNIIITGDISSEIEKKLVNKYTDEYLDSQILKVSHHGSKYSSCQEFLEVVSPEISIVQVGKNNYGHPSEDTLKNLKNNSKKVFRNDMNGAIGLTIDNQKIIINTMIK